MIDRAHLCRIGDDPGLAVPHKCVGLDAVPERAADVDELLHPVIARAMLHQLVEAVIRCIGVSAGGDHVEGDTAVGDVIE